jgi:hypothetical protein
LSLSLFYEQSFADPSRTPQATDAEAAELYRTMGAYAGRYKTDGDKLIVIPRSRQDRHSLERSRLM